MCEEFPGTLPSDIMAEMDRLPVGLLDEIIESRSYARAYAANTRDPKGSSSSDMRQQAMVIEFELAQEEIRG